MGAKDIWLDMPDEMAQWYDAMKKVSETGSDRLD